MAPKKKAKKSILLENGNQLYLGIERTPAATHAELTRIKRAWDKLYTTILDEEGDGLPCCFLQCKGCNAKLSPANPAQAAKAHSSSCAAIETRHSPRRSGGSSASGDDDLLLELPSPSRGKTSGSGNLRQTSITTHIVRGYWYRY